MDARGVRWVLAALYLATAAIVTVQRGIFAFANDYAIFRASFRNLVRGADLYVLHKEQATDLFKYSPTFAALFAPLAVLPFPVGLFIWNAGGAILLLVAIRRLLPDRRADIVLALVYFAMLRNMQSAQSNSLVAALIILAFVALEQERLWPAASSIGIGAAIKLFPAAALAFVLPNPHRRRFGMAFALVLLVLAAMPLLFTNVAALSSQYASWRVLHASQMSDNGQSVMAVLRAGFGFDWPQWNVQAVGTALLLLPVAVGAQRYRRDRSMRLDFLSSVLLYCVIFNHKAEPQSFIIAIAGVAIWSVGSAEGGDTGSAHASFPSAFPQIARALTAVVAVAMTSLVSTELTPNGWRHAITPLWRGAVPCSVVWVMVQMSLWRAVIRDRRRQTGAIRACPLEAAYVPPILTR